MSGNGVRPTGARAYSDGTGTFHPPERRLVSGGSIRGERRLRVDACVIGSGAGGAVVAKELAEGGMRVAVLEEGEWWDTDAFTARPREMSTRLYRDAGQLTTVGNPPIVLPLGRAVGGTTLVNSGTCFRTPGAVLEPPLTSAAVLLKLMVFSGTRKPIDALPLRNVFSSPNNW